ncbi:hypothetical protein [Polymorphospora rubra]|uniref:hypothetical protein n=1 Tax=Polymorphospora rubra TaxID=338584 RepID=UPI0033F97055
MTVQPIPTTAPRRPTTGDFATGRADYARPRRRPTTPQLNVPVPERVPRRAAL